MEWYSIDMPAASLKSGAYHKFCRAFQHAFIDAGAPEDLAMYAMRRSDRNRRLYLTPSSGTYVPDLIRSHGGRPCSAPDESSVTLVYGVAGSRRLLATTGSNGSNGGAALDATVPRVAQGRGDLAGDGVGDGATASIHELLPARRTATGR